MNRRTALSSSALSTRDEAMHDMSAMLGDPALPPEHGGFMQLAMESIGRKITAVSPAVGHFPRSALLRFVTHIVTE